MAEEKKEPRNRRRNDFLQSLSFWLVMISALGGFLILIDPQFSHTFDSGMTLKLGSDGFSQELKGAVVTTMLLGGFTSLVAFWFGASKTGQDNAQTVQRIAEATPPPTNGAQKAPLKAETVNVDAQTAVVNTAEPDGKG